MVNEKMSLDGEFIKLKDRINKEKLRKQIIDKTKELTDKYPTEGYYGSKCSLWGCALRDGIISRDMYDSASEFYGKLWNYAGD